MERDAAGLVGYLGEFPAVPAELGVLDGFVV